MDHQKTTHVLLTIAVVGILFLIYLFMQEKYFNKPTVYYQPITEEPVYVPPVNNPINPPATNPASGSTVPVLTVSNVELSTGDQVVVGYAEDSNQVLYTLCHQDSATWTFNKYGLQGCGMAEELILYKRKISLLLNTLEDKKKMEELNARYNITAIALSNNSYRLTIPNDSMYDSLEISKAYFSTGYFSNIRPDIVDTFN